MIALVPVRQDSVAYCAYSRLIFTYEERDLFAEEVFCPECASRVRRQDRSKNIKTLLERFPHAKIYRAPRS